MEKMVASVLGLSFVVGLASCGSSPSKTAQAPPKASKTSSKASSPSSTSPSVAPSSSASGGSSTKSGSNLPVVKIAADENGEAGFAVGYIKAKHLDIHNGVDLKPFYTSIPNAITAPLTGIAPVSEVMVPPNVIANNAKNHTKLMIFGPVLWFTDSIVATKKGGNTLASYKGDPFGGQPTSGSSFLFDQIYAMQHGLNLTKDFHYKPGAPPAVVALMERGSTPISDDFNPFTSELLATGKFKVIANLGTYFQKTIGTKAFKVGVGSTMAWVQAHPKLATDIRNAFLEANQAIASGKAKPFYMSHVAKYFGIKNPKEAELAYKRVRQDYVTVWGPKFWKSQNQLLKEAQKLNLVPQHVSVNLFWKKS